MDWIYELTGLVHRDHIGIVINTWSVLNETDEYVEVKKGNKFMKLKISSMDLVHPAGHHSAKVFCWKATINEMEDRLRSYLGSNGP